MARGRIHIAVEKFMVFYLHSRCFHSSTVSFRAHGTIGPGPLKTSFESQPQPMARTQLPLRLAWAVTVHISQGLTLPRIRLGLGPKEFSCGLTFVVLSRVTSLHGLHFIEKLDWDQVKKLGGKFLQLRLEDLARRYQGT